MEVQYVYLTVQQGFALVSEIEKLKKNPYFNDSIAEDFMQNVYMQAKIITLNNIDFILNIIQKLQGNNKIIVTKSKFDYITRLTGVDVFDKETMRQYMARIKNATDSIEQNKQSGLRR